MGNTYDSDCSQKASTEASLAQSESIEFDTLPEFKPPYLHKISEKSPALTPPDLKFCGIHPEFVKVRLIATLIPVAILFIATVIIAVLGFIQGQVWWPALFVLVPVALTIWILWLVPRQVKAYGFAQNGDEVVICSGVMFRKLEVVPYGRMQYVDVSQGPVERFFGLASVKLETAASLADLKIIGLTPAEAHKMRKILTSLGEKHMAGL